MACNGCGLAAPPWRRAAARSKATEASGLAGLARDGINGGNDWGRLRGLESGASPQDVPPTDFGVTGWMSGIGPHENGRRQNSGWNHPLGAVRRSRMFVASTAA